MTDTKKNGTMIVVSNRLPFSRETDKAGASKWHKSVGGLITAIEPFLIKENGIWIGWDGQKSEDTAYKSLELLDSRDLFPRDRQQEDNENGYQVGCIPLNADEIAEYYDCISNCTLWSLFHYFFEKCRINPAAWETYVKVNQRFAAYIDQAAADDDIVWIQDYHLFLVPYYLRRLRPRLQIHFFLHIPFPHSDIFSILPWQDMIIESLLCCQTVGFHHRQYLKNFEEVVRRFCSERKIKEHQTSFYNNPISVDFNLFNRTDRLPEIVKRKNEIKKTCKCPKMIIGVDRIDYSKGIKERLLAIEMLIEKYPELKEQFFYYQLVVPSRESTPPYKTLKKEIDEIVGRINGSFSTGLWTPVNYHYATVPFEELAALYSASDIALVTPLRDGMNLVSKEYVAAHSDDDGILILSKFAGAASELTDSILVNPYSIEGIVEAIYRAFHMPKKERVSRMTRMRRIVSKHDIHSWLRECLKQFTRTTPKD